ncbi:hypothetical protein IP84_03510 [beta proteobacterium AAP99]|nr:hypothetical protein IP84_03510 [beta proteobacterium AAP99]
MPSIARLPLPADSLLQPYAQQQAYTDCYGVPAPGAVTLPQLLEAFYTGGVFKLERALIGLLLRRPATDADAQRLARAETQHFSAWRVEERSANQILLCDLAGATRSWLHVGPAPAGYASTSVDASGQWLYFGSAVIPTRRADGAVHFGVLFWALLGVHRLYSRVLLAQARRALQRRSS